MYTTPPGIAHFNFDLKTAVRKQVNGLDIDTYFDTLANLPKTNPPTAQDARSDAQGWRRPCPWRLHRTSASFAERGLHLYRRNDEMTKQNRKGDRQSDRVRSALLSALLWWRR